MGADKKIVPEYLRWNIETEYVSYDHIDVVLQRSLCAINILRIALYVHHDDRYGNILPPVSYIFSYSTMIFQATYFPREIVTNIIYMNITDVIFCFRLLILSIGNIQNDILELQARKI